MIRLSDEIIRLLNNIITQKNNIIPQEICYRISASLELPCFNTIELTEMKQLRNNINQIGNFLNQCVREKIIVNENHLLELKKLINQLKFVLQNIIIVLSQRLL